MANSDSGRFSRPAVALHWVMALAIVGLFALGLYMVDLDYYHPWYNSAPQLHQSLGIVLGLLLLLRVGVRLALPPPLPLPSISATERALAGIAHGLLYVLILLVVATGYLIASADDTAVAVFSWFSVPALPVALEGQEDIAGLWHEWLAWALIALAAVHAAAALKHHFIDRDDTLRRMLGR